MSQMARHRLYEPHAMDFLASSASKDFAKPGACALIQIDLVSFVPCRMHHELRTKVIAMLVSCLHVERTRRRLFRMCVLSPLLCSV